LVIFVPKFFEYGNVNFNNCAFVSAILSAIFIPNDKVSNHAKDSDV